MGTVLVVLACSVGTIFFTLAATCFLWGPWLLNTMASHNFIITSVEEGTAKAIMKYGEFHRFVMSWKGHYMDENWNVVPLIPGDGHRPNETPMDHWLDHFLPGGLRYIGWPFGNTIFTYHFQWTSIRQGAPDKGEQKERGIEAIVIQDDLKDLMESRDEQPDYVFLKRDVYGFTFPKVDDAEMIPLTFISLMTAQVINPYKALFHTEQWLEQIENFLRSYIKDYVGAKDFRSLTNCAKGSKGQSDEILAFPAPDGTIGEYILKEWGVQIDHINLVNFRTASEAYEKAASLQYVGRQEALAIAAKAEGEGKRISTLAIGEADRIEKIAVAEAERIEKVTAAIQKGGDIALTLRALEAFEKAGEDGNTVVIGQNPVQSLLDLGKTKTK